jgi:hypothetical protein
MREERGSEGGKPERRVLPGLFDLFNQDTTLTPCRCPFLILFTASYPCNVEGREIYAILAGKMGHTSEERTGNGHRYSPGTGRT